jgi:hypothetical protein
LGQTACGIEFFAVFSGSVPRRYDANHGSELKARASLSEAKLEPTADKILCINFKFVLYPVFAVVDYIL